ncbi:tRNA 2-thiouridine(34) synthase MnmA [Pseudoteredinibacter isoporae]|uniref:tRNA-specific 2-thiouridylase MnmA n=1 Tax=Pseudoteredinibacter isoporae TaxID=570281 RepID=A0A7X0JSR2_9GAMM|nr:tRNA 2-thiouridine(34) synthase MnmA [Pseudoteredinibacter isoporae]MBB6521608.1 tRNA-specific 2-thiouridylase [Pseudoteredinibacter isoporae]NHO87162.1 tRNA 2-thiouridine(34) synthase MnmA [Pseudoteredinibacter isoporae]NIB22986.1 tRNA 2-thiouridine(34) synthase MnmA [Pseudoteredinibacter isoporae]
MSPSSKPISETKVIVGMSGGVDSSVSALLLLQAGYQVEGLFMKNWDEDDGSEYCTAKDDLADAESVCAKLGIKLHSANFAAEYWDNVFEHFLEEYKAGRTPNPDILCNREIKFKVFLDYAELLGADYIATGHYVRRLDEGGRTYLAKGLDNNKDQSYFLHAVSEAEFAKSLFPVGELEKPEVRVLAEEHGLITHNKKDSTGICFIGERRFKDFLAQYLPAQPGVIEDLDGNALGQHSGLMYHTIGQRQGLGIGGVKGQAEAPWYVVDKDLERNVLLVAQGSDHPRLYKQSLSASQSHWIGNNPCAHGNVFHGHSKIRYRQADQECWVRESADGGLEINFAEPQRAVTPGQSIVFYKEDICLGGAVIDQAQDELIEELAAQVTEAS